MCDICDTDGEYYTCNCPDCERCGERVCPTCHHISMMYEIWPDDDEDEEDLAPHPNPAKDGGKQK
jgi:hypothetical protein